MKLSYWEYDTWLSNIDFTIVGSGIVGLNCALHLSENFPKAKILVLEQGSLPQGASTKNAGFACFGSISEILSDLKKHSEEEVVQLVQQRWDGIQLLRQTLGDKAIDFQQHGGHELFLQAQTTLYENCQEQLNAVNDLLEPVFKTVVFRIHENNFQFQNIHQQYITHSLEGQIHTGKMMKTLLEKVQKKGIIVLNNSKVEAFNTQTSNVTVNTTNFEFKTKKLLIATNGFAAQLIKENVAPARAQVLITQPIRDLDIKGTFHFDEGYYYFRNIADRILFGGGRNLNFKGEETDHYGRRIAKKTYCQTN